MYYIANRLHRIAMTPLHMMCNTRPFDAPREVRQAYERRFRNFEKLESSSDTLLFVRVVATTSELGRAYELTQALSKKFGQQAALLPPGLYYGSILGEISWIAM